MGSRTIVIGTQEVKVIKKTLSEPLEQTSIKKRKQKAYSDAYVPPKQFSDTAEENSDKLDEPTYKKEVRHRPRELFCTICDKVAVVMEKKTNYPDYFTCPHCGTAQPRKIDKTDYENDEDKYFSTDDEPTEASIYRQLRARGICWYNPGD